MTTAPRPLVWSYTFLSDLENCNYKAYRKHVVRDLPYVQTKEMAWGDTVHKSFEKRLTIGAPLPADMDRYEWFAKALDGRPAHVEYRLGLRRDGMPCTFSSDDVWGRGKLDWASLGGTTAVLMDWKTGKKREDSQELEIQALLLQAKHPELRTIMGHYVWLSSNELGICHDVSDTTRTFHYVQKVMEKTDESRRLKHWPKRENPLCGWCPVEDCEFNTVKKRTR